MFQYVEFGFFMQICSAGGHFDPPPKVRRVKRCRFQIFRAPIFLEKTDWIQIFYFNYCCPATAYTLHPTVFSRIMNKNIINLQVAKFYF